MTTFTIHTADSAPAESKQQLESTQQRKGLIPNLYGVLAEEVRARGRCWLLTRTASAASWPMVKIGRG